MVMFTEVCFSYPLLLKRLLYVNLRDVIIQCGDFTK
jgi:hypothetical protein